MNDGRTGLSLKKITAACHVKVLVSCVLPKRKACIRGYFMCGCCIFGYGFTFGIVLRKSGRRNKIMDVFSERQAKLLLRKEKTNL